LEISPDSSRRYFDTSGLRTIGRRLSFVPPEERPFTSALAMLELLSRTVSAAEAFVRSAAVIRSVISGPLTVEWNLPQDLYFAAFPHVAMLAEIPRTRVEDLQALIGLACDCETLDRFHEQENHLSPRHNAAWFADYDSSPAASGRPS
jgi:hypothetical protein